ncbi:WD repeat-containing protein 62-like [Discoglossus pictus]
MLDGTCQSRARGQQGGAGRGGKVELELVLGLTVPSNSSVTCDPKSGLIAYTAGCVIVILCPKKNEQNHIFNTSSKQLSSLSFSRDGKYLVTGESGHKPAVRIWEVGEKVMVSEMLGHKYGVSCVRFSPNMKYVVSVGYQHDMVVNVWDWKANNIVAKNKVSSKVVAISFSEDSSYFVTVGNRHVRFWYLETSKNLQVNGTVPLVGRSGLLGDLHDNVFCGVACGRGQNMGSTFCIANSGILCQFSEKRVLEKWIKLKVSASTCLTVTEHYVFCGCVEGTVRVFSAQTLQYIADLPRPHYLGVDVSLGLDPSTLFAKQTDSSYPDTSALVYDEYNQWICCVYNDHSLYVWDVKDTKKVGKVYSALYHSAYVWNVEIYPEVEDKTFPPAGSFLTCSSDNTIRLWNTSSNPRLRRNIYSNDLHKVIYVDSNTQYLKDNSVTSEKSDSKDTKSGVRVIKVRPDGQHLASGDRVGNIRVYDLGIFDELLAIEAHDGEVLCLEYSKPLTGVTMLASASRDRLIHILDVDNGYSLQQTLDDHSSSITAVKFAGDHEQMHMISCGADKSIYFRTAQMLTEGIYFPRMHHVVEKTTLYDMDVDLTQKSVAVACQDKNIRLYNVSSGKQEKCLKGSASGGALLKVQMDPSGTFFATSCSNKNICIYDVQSGECVATVYGHSDIITDIKFTPDCKRLITVSGDSCVFIWQLDHDMTTSMLQRLEDMGFVENPNITSQDDCLVNIRRQTYFTDFFEDNPHNGNHFFDKSSYIEDSSTQTPPKDFFEADPPSLQTNGKMPLWVKKLEGHREDIPLANPTNNYQPRGRWATSGSQDLRNILVANDHSCFNTPNNDKAETSFLDDQTELEYIEPKNLQHLLEQSEEENYESLSNATYICEPSTSSEDNEVKFPSRNVIFYPEEIQISEQEGSDFSVVEHCISPDTFQKDNMRSKYNSSSHSQQDGDDDSLSNSETNSIGDNDSQESSQPPTSDETFLLKHFDNLSDNFADEKFDNTLDNLKPTDDDENDLFLNPRLSISSRFLYLCQKNGRLANSHLPRGLTTSTDSTGDTEKERPSNPKKPVEKPTEDKIHERLQKKRISNGDVTESSKPIIVLQKAHINEKAASRSSFPGCWPNKEGPLSKASKRRSYMEATASSKAKITRCVSMGDHIDSQQGEDHKRSNLFRPASSNDLLSLEPEDKSRRRLSSEQSFCGSSEIKRRASLNSNSISDKLLMPPPPTFGVLSRLKKKAKSFSNLSKESGRDEPSCTTSKKSSKKDASTCNGPLDHQHPNKTALSLLDLSSHADDASNTISAVHESQDHEVYSVSGRTSNDMSESGAAPEARNVEESGAVDRFAIYNESIKELHKSFQKALTLYKEVDSSSDSPEVKLQTKSLFSEAFDYLRGELDLVSGIHTRKTYINGMRMSKEKLADNPTLDLLGHYSEMMVEKVLEMMNEKINHK